MTLDDLQQQYNIDPEIIRIWAERESETLLPVQEAAIREYQILEGNDLLVSAPTSSGKTFLAEIAAIHAIFQRKKVIYLLPLKALAEEKYADFAEKYADFGIDVVISTGDRTEFDSAIERGDFQLAVIVFEKANRLLVRNKNFINNCGLIVIDEVQMTSDYARGSGLELLLTAILVTHLDLEGFPQPSRSRPQPQNLEGQRRLSRSQMQPQNLEGQRRPSRSQTQPQDLEGLRKPSRMRPQLIALSAVISQVNRLDEWLWMQTLLSDSRPVELREGILRKDGTFTYKGFISKEIGTEAFPPFPPHLKFNLKTYEGRREYVYRRLLHNVSFLLSQGEQVLVFLKWKSLTRDIALRLARELQLPPALKAIEVIQQMEDSISKEMLLEALRHGIAFHNADLGRDERRAIEQYFRAEDSKIRVVCATSTLAMGINLPVKTVIINDLEKPDQDAAAFQEIPLTPAEYKNMSGRAGRLKRQDEGRSIIFAETPAEERILWRNYIEGTFPRMESQLSREQLLQEALFLIASGICLTDSELYDFMLRSYAGRLYWTEDYAAAEAMQTNITVALEFCLKHELIAKTTTETFLATEIGRICAMQGVSVETFVTLRRLFQELDPETCCDWELLFIIIHNQELEDVHFRLSQKAFETGEFWRALQERNPGNWEALTQKSEELLQSRFEVTKRVKMSLLLLDWIAGVSIQKLEITYNRFYTDKSYSGAIRGLTENASWILRLLADIATAQHEPQATIDRIQRLANRVLYGIPETGIELSALRVSGLTRAMVMRLANAGYTSEEQVLDVELEELSKIIPKEIAFRLQDKLYKKYSRAESRHLVDQKLRLERLGYDTAFLKQIYAAVTLEEFAEALLELFRSPQLKLIVQAVKKPEGAREVVETYGYDYTLERESGTVLLRILPPNMWELSDDLWGNLLTVGMKYNPAAFILVGRPDFSEETYSKAKQFATTYAKAVTLYPAYEICERYVLVLEGKEEFQL